MAEKLTVRTDGHITEFHVGDTTITPAGVEVSKTELKTLQDAAFRSRIRLYVSGVATEEQPDTGTASAADTGVQDPSTPVQTGTTTPAQTDTSSGARNKRS